MIRGRVTVIIEHEGGTTLLRTPEDTEVELHEVANTRELIDIDPHDHRRWFDIFTPRRAFDLRLRQPADKVIEVRELEAL